jgi:hypothetical protein
MKSVNWRYSDLPRQRREEQHQEDDRQAVLLEELAHQLCRSPSVTQ